MKMLFILQRAGGQRLLLQLLARFIVLLGLVMTIAFMVSATIIISLIHAYIVLLEHGISARVVFAIVGTIALLFIAILLFVLMWQLKALHHHPKKSPLIDMLDAFAEGLMNEK